MARGRMINKKISLNKNVNELSSDTCKLAFTWTISHLDRDGRIHGDPEILKAIIFPRRKDITNKMMESFIHEWAEKKLVIWYSVNGDLWIEFPKFRENQAHLRYEREPESNIPPSSQGIDVLKPPDPPKKIDSGKSPAKSRKDAGKHPAEEKLNEFKLKEVKQNQTNSPPTDSPSAHPPEFLSPNPNPPPRDGPLQTDQFGPDGKKLLSPEDVSAEKMRQREALKTKYPEAFAGKRGAPPW